MNKIWYSVQKLFCCFDGKYGKNLPQELKWIQHPFSQTSHNPLLYRTISQNRLYCCRISKFRHEGASEPKTAQINISLHNYSGNIQTIKYSKNTCKILKCSCQSSKHPIMKSALESPTSYRSKKNPINEIKIRIRGQNRFVKFQSRQFWLVLSFTI